MVARASLLVLLIGLLCAVCASVFVARRGASSLRSFPLARRAMRAHLSALPERWSWQHVTHADAQIAQRVTGRALAPGRYASPVFDQHSSRWCGCCYLVAAVQMIQDRLHVAMGRADHAAIDTMEPVLEFDMQRALDMYQAEHAATRSDGWNACKGGMPTSVLQAISDGRVDLVLTVSTRWRGHPVSATRTSAPVANTTIGEPTVLPNAPRELMLRLITEGPLVLGINSLCLRDPRLARRKGVVDTTIVAPRDHAVTVIGWRPIDGRPHWILRNSWGTEQVPTERPDAACVGVGFNECDVRTTSWVGDPDNPGHAYVDVEYAGLAGSPSAWYDAPVSV